MSSELKSEIIKLLDEKASIMPNTQQNPPKYSYASLQEKVFQLELHQEIHFLRGQLDSEEEFEDVFKMRCHERWNNKEIALSLKDAPKSITNELYWNLALIIFKPKTMGEMLQILAPDVKRYVSLTFPDIIPQGGSAKDRLRLFIDSALRLDIESNLNNLPDLDELNHYVVESDCIMDTRCIARFPLRGHIAAYRLLMAKEPLLAKKLYEHNSDLKKLFSDVLLFLGKGMNPKSAIEQLIHALNLGGARFTDKTLALESANQACVWFLSYLEMLPKETYLPLLSLEYERGKTLSDLVENEIKQHSCAETIATYFEQLLLHNTNHPVLLSPPQMTPEQVKQLERRYQYISARDKTRDSELLSTEKDEFHPEALPSALALSVFQTDFPVETLEQLVSLLIEFPTSFYGTIWHNLMLENSDDILSCLEEVIELISQPQKRALARAINDNYERFHAQEPFLHWVIRSDDPIFVHEAIQLTPEEQRIIVLKNGGKKHNNKTLLYFAASVRAFNSLKVMLEFFPKEQRAALVKMAVANHHGNTIMHYVAEAGALVLKAVLEFIPKEQRLDVLKVTNKMGNSALHYALASGQGTKIIFETLPVNQILAMLKSADKNGRVVFHKIKENSAPILLAMIAEGVRDIGLVEDIIHEKTPAYNATHCIEELGKKLDHTENEPLIFLTSKLRVLLDEFYSHLLFQSDSKEFFRQFQLKWLDVKQELLDYKEFSENIKTLDFTFDIGRAEKTLVSGKHLFFKHHIIQYPPYGGRGTDLFVIRLAKSGNQFTSI